MKKLICYRLIYIFLLFSTTFINAQNELKEAIKKSKIGFEISETVSPLIEQRKAKVNFYVKAQLPIIPLENLNPDEKLVQELCFKNPNFTKYTKNSKGQNYINEIFGIYPVRPGDVNPKLLTDSAKLYRIEMFNFVLNVSTIAIVDINTKKFVFLNHYESAQPDIPISLKELAIEIAAKNKEVIEELGYQPTIKDALMPNTKTSLNKTRCERSQHLCVAPTFIKNDKALWAIVDLTSLKIAGIRWTNVGVTGPSLVTERNVQDDKITACYCEQLNNLKKDNWEVNYHLTTSDGLEIVDVKFNNLPVIKSVKLVDWHVSYSSTDGFGYSDAIGCPFFSQAAVYANQPPTVSDLKVNNETVGFVIDQQYFNPGWPMPCNYNYVQRYEFYKDGKFRVTTASIGRGCGNDGTYRPVFRIALQNAQGFEEWNGQDWKKWDTENWTLQNDTTTLTKEKYLYKINTSGGGYFVEPNVGQFNDKSRGDNAFSYVTTYKTEEGENNLITIGPCCNTDYKQGPEKFIEPNPESLLNKELVFWYVPKMRNDDRKGYEYCWAESVLKNGVYESEIFPCFVGPMFVPFK